MMRRRRMGMGSVGHPSGFTIDLTSAASSYAGLTVALTGTVYLLVNGVPTLYTGATTPLWEDLDTAEGGGVHVFPTTTNSAPSANDYTIAGWSKFRNAVVLADSTLGPDGLTMAQRVTDGTAGDSSELRYVLPGGARQQTTTVWLKDATPVGTLQPMLLRAGYTGTNVPWQTSGVRIPIPAWRRVSSFDFASATWIGLSPDAGGANHSSTITGVGAVHVWGFQSTEGPMSPPLITSGSARSELRLAAHETSEVIKGGIFDIKITWAPSLGDMTSRVVSAAQNPNIGDVSYLPQSYIFSCDTPDGLAAIRHRASSGGAASYYTLTVRGVDVLSTPTGGWTGLLWAGQRTTVRPYYNPVSGVSGIRMSVNGCFVPDTTGVASGALLAAATSAEVGTNLGSATAALTGRIFKIERPSSPIQAVEPVEFIFIGDSVFGTFGVTYVSVGSLIYTRAEIDVRRGIGSIAASGHQVIAQSAAFSSSPWSSASGIACVVAQIGINNVIAGDSAAVLIGKLQTFVNTIRAAQPLAKIIFCQMLPCKTYLDSLNVAFQAVWAAVNDAIAGRGGSPITGLDDVVLGGDVGSPLNNGSNSLTPALGTGDFIHTNNPGRVVNAAMVRAKMVAQGVLP